MMQAPASRQLLAGVADTMLVRATSGCQALERKVFASVHRGCEPRGEWGHW